MSGGIAYVWDPAGRLPAQCNMGSLGLEALTAAEDVLELKALLENHARYTGSTVARQVLDDWERSLAGFVKVMPTEYQRVLAERKAASAA